MTPLRTLDTFGMFELADGNLRLITRSASIEASQFVLRPGEAVEITNDGSRNRYLIRLEHVDKKCNCCGK